MSPVFSDLDWSVARVADLRPLFRAIRGTAFVTKHTAYFCLDSFWSAVYSEMARPELFA